MTPCSIAYLLPSRLYCRYRNFTDSAPKRSRTVTAGGESHPALKILFTCVFTIAQHWVLVKGKFLWYPISGESPGTIRDETGLSSGAEARSATKLPLHKDFILKLPAHYMSLPVCAGWVGVVAGAVVGAVAGAVVGAVVGVVGAVVTGIWKLRIFPWAEVSVTSPPMTLFL